MRDSFLGSPSDYRRVAFDFGLSTVATAKGDGCTVFLTVFDWQGKSPNVTDAFVKTIKALIPINTRVVFVVGLYVSWRIRGGFTSLHIPEPLGDRFSIDGSVLDQEHQMLCGVRYPAGTRYVAAEDIVCGRFCRGCLYFAGVHPPPKDCFTRVGERVQAK